MGYRVQRSQSDILLLVLGLLAELPQIHQAAHDLTQLHPPDLRPVEVCQIPVQEEHVVRLTVLHLGLVIQVGVVGGEEDNVYEYQVSFHG